MYDICGLTYNDRPKSRVEKLLIDIINGGIHPTPSEITIGNGLKVVGNTLQIDTTDTFDSATGRKPFSTQGLAYQLEKAETVMDRI